MHNQARRRWWVHLAAGLAVAGFVALLYCPLLFTNRVLATGDILLYFYPYRDFVASALREGRVPFWNPYLFGGVPLLANPQAAVLYPLHWPLIWLPVTKQVYWSAAVHTWLLGMGGYCLLRYWGGGVWAGLVTALVLSGAGIVGGLMGHLNQLNVAAWGPWAVLCVEGANLSTQGNTAVRWPGVLARSAALGLVVAVMLLAGHTQTVYIVLFGLGVWCLWPAVQRQWRETLARLIVYAAGVVLGALLSAPQLLPTLELSSLGLRTGGLSYLDATSFSLKPLQLPWTLLPSYGLLSMQAVFDTPAYTEFVAYIGVIGLVLAVLGAWKGRGRGRAFGLVLVVAGLALGLGRWNPLYFPLHAAVPGFDLFRVPARWMLLYTYGAAVLAGLGAQWLLLRLSHKLGARTPAWAAPILLLLVAADLLLAAHSQPHTHSTAPEAVDGVRSAPAHLLTDPNGAASPAAGGRFLGLSTITYDPGDMPDYKRIMLGGSPPQLDQAAFDDLVIAQKVQELLVPNLALLWRIPSIDGFDGGVLPLQRYNKFAQLLIPPEQYVPDGRLREQLQAVPPASLLNLMNVQYLITDKVRDLWFEDLYYDRQIGARLDEAQRATEIAVGQDNALEATHLDLITYAEAAGDVWAGLTGAAIPVASVTITSSEGVTQTFTVTAGGAAGAQLADGNLDSSLAQASGATVALRDVDAGRQEYRVRLPLATPLTPESIEVQLLDNRFTLALQAATLFDARTGMFAALLPSDRGHFARVHSGDVKIYANQDLLARATVVTQTLQAGGPEQAAALLQAQLARRPSAPVLPVVEGMAPLQDTGGDTAKAEIINYAAERVEIHTAGENPGLLVLADAFYPGWHASVDGHEVPIYPTNVLFRGVPVPAGDHSVVFTFEPAGWRLGLIAGAVGLVLTVVLGLLAGWGFRRQRDHAV
ncbi:MAG: YfhO family protein [Caldilineaceae bacterium]